MNYRDKFYEKYISTHTGQLYGDLGLGAIRRQFPIWQKYFGKFLPKEKSAKIGDFGCGNGIILKTIKSINPEARLIGLDVSETALSEARITLPEAEFYKITDGGQLPLKDKIADFVFSSEVLEHIYDVENAFSEIARILKLGGRLLLTTPYHGLLKNILIALFSFNKHFNPTGPHIRFFSKRTLFSLLKKNGFEIEKYGFYGRFYPLSHSIYILAKKV